MHPEKRRDDVKKRIFSALVVYFMIFMFPVFGFAGSCLECHQKYGVTVKVPTPPPIKIMVDGKEDLIGLDRAFQFHGHECAGIAIAYRAVQYGIKLLFPHEIPKRDDLMVTTRIPASGVRDFLDLFMKGDRGAEKAVPPAGMEKSRDGFVFTMLRKSTCDAVEIRLNPERFPTDFFVLNEKKMGDKITLKEWDKLHGYLKTLILEVPVQSDEELFGTPRPYKVIVWGTLKPGELDKNIRKARQEEKKKAL